MKRNADYWAERFKLIEQAEHNRGAAAVSDIEKQYREAQRQLEAKLDAWYRRFADNNQVSMTEAKKMLAGRDLKEFKWDVHEYIRYVRKKGSTFDDLQQSDADLLANHINSTKRDSLNGHSPFELSQMLLDEKLLTVMNYRAVAPDDVMLTPELLK